MPTLMLIDGHALVHRAFHAIRPLTTRTGELTNAVFGFTQMLIKAMNDHRPEYAAVAFDLAAPTFRHLEYTDYKAQRPRAPEGLHEQFDRVRQVVRALGIPIFEAEGYEADDVLGTLARQATADGIDTLVVTGDADALQFVGPHVRVLTPHKGMSETMVYDEAAVRERFGVSPQQIPDFKALKGDASDNIKGVRGIGEKTAAKLLQQYDGLENLIAHHDELDSKVAAALDADGERAVQSKRLATIVTDAPVKLDLEACRVGRYDRAQLVELLRELEFRSLLGRLPPTNEGEETRTDASAPGLFDGLEGEARGDAEAPAVESVTYTIVDTPDLLRDVVAQLARAESFTVDTETTDQDRMRAQLVGISLAVTPGQAWYIPVGHVLEQQSRLSLDTVREALAPVFADPTRAKVGHNLKYDAIVLYRCGLPLRGLQFDTMLATYLLESSQRALSLKDVVFDKLGIQMTPIEQLIGKGKNQRGMAEVPLADVAKYASADADMTLRLRDHLAPQLEVQGLRALFDEVEMPLLPVLARMEMTGVALDLPFLKDLSDDLAERLGILEVEIYGAAGHEFNINSTQQLAQVLYSELGLPTNRKTRTGFSTDAATLEALRGTHEIIGLILDYRQLVKLKSTYVDALPNLVNPETRRVHTSFNQTGAATGRISSSQPNLQNIPVRTELGRQVRRAFIAGRPDNVILSADYSQVELRILAHLTQEERLLSAFAAGEDIHAATASDVFGVPIPSVTREQRELAKKTNFGLIYGQGDFGLASQLGISRRDAADFIQRYFEKYPKVRQYLDATKLQVRELGYVSTLMGRRRFLPDIRANNPMIRAEAERMAVNAPIQGTNADIIKVAMIRLDRELTERRLDSKMILQVHDELVFEVPRNELDEVADLAREVMEGAYTLSVPLKVDVSVGPNWTDVESRD